MEYPVVFERRKFGELLLHAAAACEDDIRFGLSKLGRILYFSDLKAFAMLGAPITGATYRRGERGPVPAELRRVLREMEAEGELRVAERRDLNLRQRRVEPLRAPDLGVFDARELEIADRVMLELRTLDASRSPLLSHLDLAWRIARSDEAIPYHASWISDRRPTHRELAERGLEAPAGW